MEQKNRYILFGLIAFALILGIVAFDPGMWSNVAFAQGPKPTPPKSKAPIALVGTAFTYQGQIKSSGVPVNGNCYLQFNLYSDAGGTSLVAGPVNGNPNPVSVTNGLFTVQIDFGSGVFQGQARWLKTSVKCGSDSGFTPLSLQPLTATPYSLSTAWGQSMWGTGVGLEASSSDRIGLAGVATSSPFVLPFTLGMMGVYGRGDDVGVWGEPYTNNGVGVEGSHSSSSNYGQIGTSNYGVYGSSPSGVGVEGIHTNSGNYGELGAWYAGVHGESSGYDGVSGHATTSDKSGVYGVNDGGGYGVYGACSGSGCYGVYSYGNMRVQGNLQVDGQANGFFPRPAYDSGFVYVTNCSTLNHNLGGNAQNYVVDVVTGNSNGTIMNNMLIGGYYDDVSNVQGWVGYWYKNLTSTSVDICTGILPSYTRLRIWVYK